MMEEFIGVRLGAREFRLCTELKTEFKFRSLSEVMRFGVIELGKNRSEYEHLKELASKLLLDTEAEYLREESRAELRKITLLNRQLSLISSLKRQGIREENLQDLKEKLNNELKRYGINYIHAKDKPLEVKRR